MIIRVYNGHGTSWISASVMRERLAEFGLDSSFIDETEIRQETDWMHKTNLFVCNGDSVTKFKEALCPGGEAKLKTYIDNGGTYLGICAGSYFGAGVIDFTGASFQKRRNGLGLFNGLARGALEDLMGRPYTGLSDCASVITLRYAKDLLMEFPALYWGGPHFLLPEKTPNITPLFWHATPQSTRLMGLASRVGERGGAAFLVSPHCELSAKNIERYVGHFSASNKTDQTLFEQFLGNAKTFDRIFEILLWEMGLSRTLPEFCPTVTLTLSARA